MTWPESSSWRTPNERPGEQGQHSRSRTETPAKKHWETLDWLNTCNFIDKDFKDFSLSLIIFIQESLHARYGWLPDFQTFPPGCNTTNIMFSSRINVSLFCKIIFRLMNINVGQIDEPIALPVTKLNNVGNMWTFCPHLKIICGSAFCQNIVSYSSSCLGSGGF